ncbi:uncharacterized protein LOC122546503, partial [Chiloscyllium plagiosum]|uniref:uncharacterized protein LOC122546503 n=1 Tax=Chiloscyllium plagiosum TaxID=36176 RepID=UPI001CB7FB96
RLRTPQIIQHPTYIRNYVQLNCLVRDTKVSSYDWQKDNRVLNNSRTTFEFDNSTLLIRDMDVSDCGVYTCIVKNEVSSSSNSHFLRSDEILFIVISIFLLSTMAFVSSLTSLCAEAVIYKALNRPQGPDQKRELTIIFLIFELVSFTCLLTASLLAVFESGFSILYRCIAGFGCLMCVAAIIYVSILFLGLNTNRTPLFLTINVHFLILFVCEILSVVISIALLYRSKQIATKCEYQHKRLIIRSLLVVLIYVFPVFVFILFYIMHFLEVEMYRQMKAFKRINRHRIRSK